MGRNSPFSVIKHCKIRLSVHKSELGILTVKSNTISFMVHAKSLYRKSSQFWFETRCLGVTSASDLVTFRNVLKTHLSQNVALTTLNQTYRDTPT